MARCYAGAASTIRIAARFRGPEHSGNGGYTAGLVAAALAPAPGQAVEVTLRRPPPLERDLRLACAAGAARLLDGEADEVELATARLATLDLEVLPPPAFAEAEAVSAHYVGHRHHGFPQCFACGPARAPGDGLRIFPGRLPKAEAGAPVAAPFVPDGSLAGADGQLGAEMIWAALDCVGYFGAYDEGTPPALLGRMTAAVLGPLAVGTPCVVMGWGLGRERRKLFAGSALYAGSRLVGLSRQVWITV
jgi:hypothetical protein